MRQYRGTASGQVLVSNDGADWALLEPRLDLRNHSPTGFAWGYGGSGPSQLALALLADACGNTSDGDQCALRNYRNVLDQLVVRWSIDQPWGPISDRVVRSAAGVKRAYLYAVDTAR